VGLWGDRLAEVWAAPGRAGAGLVVGSTGVLTARHLVADALADGRIRARVVRPGFATAAWVPMRDVWDSAEWDIALLTVEDTSVNARDWLAPTSPPVVVARLGTSKVSDCDAVGFPEAAVQRDGTADPATSVRQTEQAVGTVLPVGQSKPPRHPQRVLPQRWMPFDVDTATPGTQEGWGGMSGAGVVLPDGRLAGIVVTAESAHQERRLYLVALADVVQHGEGFAAALAELAGRPVEVQVLEAPQYRAVLQADCLGADGMPLRVAEVDDLGVFGVKPADIAGEPTYLEYVPRDDDDLLRDALASAVQERCMLLVVGDSAAGKSRSTAEALKFALPRFRLLQPRPTALAGVLNLPLSELGSAVVWLDDAERYMQADFAEWLTALLDADVAVVGTIRRAVLENLTPPGDIREPAGEALRNKKRVKRHNWKLKWSEEEKSRVARHADNAALLEQVASGVPLGVWCVAGPLMIDRLEQAKDNEDLPCRYGLVRSVLAWYHTGVNRPMPMEIALRHLGRMAELLLEPDEAEIQDAVDWATAGVIGQGRATRHSILSRSADTGDLKAHDYLLDYEPENAPPVPPEMMAATREYFPTSFAFGLAAYRCHLPEMLRPVFESMAGPHGPNPSALYNLGLINEDQRPEGSLFAYEQAAIRGHNLAPIAKKLLRLESDLGAHGDSDRRWLERFTGGLASAVRSGPAITEAQGALRVRAMNTLGRLLAYMSLGHEHLDSRLPTPAQVPDRGGFGQHRLADAEHMFKRAAIAGHVGAMFNLALLTAQWDPDASDHWYRQAAANEYPAAMNNLGCLLAESDPRTARYWFKQAAAIGHPQAIKNLGLMKERDEEAPRWSMDTTAAGHTFRWNNPKRLFELDTYHAYSWVEIMVAAQDDERMQRPRD